MNKKQNIKSNPIKVLLLLLPCGAVVVGFLWLLLKLIQAVL